MGNKIGTGNGIVPYIGVGVLKRDETDWLHSARKLFIESTPENVPTLKEMLMVLTEAKAIDGKISLQRLHDANDDPDIQQMLSAIAHSGHSFKETVVIGQKLEMKNVGIFGDDPGTGEGRYKKVPVNMVETRPKAGWLISEHGMVKVKELLKFWIEQAEGSTENRSVKTS